MKLFQLTWWLWVKFKLSFSIASLSVCWTYGSKMYYLLFKMYFSKAIWESKGEYGGDADDRKEKARKRHGHLKRAMDKDWVKGFRKASGMLSQYCPGHLSPCLPIETESVTESALTHSFRFLPQQNCDQFFQQKGNAGLTSCAVSSRGSVKGQPSWKWSVKGAKSESVRFSNLPSPLSIAWFFSW